MVNDPVPARAIVIDHGRLIVNPRDFAVRQPMLAQIAVAKVPERHEGEMVGPQSEIEAEADAGPSITPSPASKNGMRRQRRPTAAVSRYAPARPGGTPPAVGRPDPPAPRMTLPAAIVKRRPTP